MKLFGVLVVGIVLGTLTTRLFYPAHVCPEQAGGQACGGAGEKSTEVLTATGALPNPTGKSEAPPMVVASKPGVEAQDTDVTEETAEDNQPSTTKAQGKLSAVKDERDAQGFLKNNRWKDVMQKILNSKPIAAMDPQVEQLMGRYVGDVMVGGKARRVWQMVFELDGNVVGSKFLGKLKVELAENGKVFSTHSGQGPIREIRKMGDGSQAIYLEASPTHHFQLFTVPDSDMMIGNLYMKQDVGEYRFRGTAQLYKH